MKLLDNLQSYSKLENMQINDAEKTNQIRRAEEYKLEMHSHLI